MIGSKDISYATANKEQLFLTFISSKTYEMFCY